MDKKEKEQESDTTEAAEAASGLLMLQDLVHNRIKQKKGEIHESHNKAYNEGLWIQIETLQWVLNQISTMLLSRRISSKK
jgi:hypothetical protein